jgi:ankyrin repeat protein
LKLAIPYRATGNDRGLDGMLGVGTTPLLRAAKAQDAAAIKLLLEHGALIDLPNNQGMVPILAASGLGSQERDSRGNYRAADIQEHAIESLDLLLQHGGQINERVGRQQQVPLDGAAQWGWTRVISFLLGKGADVNLADSRGMTPLDYAMGRGAANGRGEIRKEAAELIASKGGIAGTPVPQQGGGGRGGRGGAPPAR